MNRLSPSSNSYPSHESRLRPKQDVPASAPLSPQRIEGNTTHRQGPPCDEKSYLKSRRAQARNVRRTNIMTMLDRNVFELSTTTTTMTEEPPASENSIAKYQHGSMNSTGTSTTTATNNTTESSSPVPSPEPEKEPATRRLFGSLFRNKDSTTTGSSSSHSRSQSPSIFRRSQSPGALSRRTTRQEQERLHQEQLIQVVLERYPKSKCHTFEEHKERAMTELIQHNKVQMTPKKMQKLETMLEEKLREFLLELMLKSAIPETKKAEVVDKTNNKSKDRRHSTGGRPRTRKPGDSKAKKGEDDDKTQRMRNTVEMESPLFVTKSRARSFETRHHHNPSNHDSSKAMEVPAPSPTSRKNSFSQRGSEPLAPLKPAKQEVHDVMLLDSSGHIGKYTGMISEKTGKPHGFGKIIYQNESDDKGISYEGEWNQGQWNGKGRLVKHNGDIYEGYFCDDEKHGLGVFYYGDHKRRFDGRFVMGHRTEGTMFYSDNSVYKGQWYNGKRHGRGTYQFSDKSVYKGEFVCDRIHGAGQLTWPDGSKYVGEWSQGQRHGMGKEYDNLGTIRYHGMWKNNKPLKDTDS